MIDSVFAVPGHKNGFFSFFHFTPGILGELDLAAQHVITEIGAITYMVHALL